MVKGSFRRSLWKILLILLTFLLLFVVVKESDEFVYIEKKMYEMNVDEVDLFLKQIKEKNRTEEIINVRIGTPYQLGCLGEGWGIDPDPLFRLDVTDCTVFVLTTTALLNSSSFKEAASLMNLLNYYPPEEISYENRLHFTTYRNFTSPYFKDITESIGGEKTKKKIVYLNKTRIIDIDFLEKIEIAYIPSLLINKELLSDTSFLGVAFLKEGDESLGLDVRHEGFILNGKDLVHASFARGEVVKEDFFNYLENSSFDGVIFFDVIISDY